MKLCTFCGIGLPEGSRRISWLEGLGPNSYVCQRHYSISYNLKGKYEGLSNLQGYLVDILLGHRLWYPNKDRGPPPEPMPTVLVLGTRILECELKYLERWAMSVGLLEMDIETVGLRLDIFLRANNHLAPLTCATLKSYMFEQYKNIHRTYTEAL